MEYANLDTDLLYSFFMFIWNLIFFSGIVYLAWKGVKYIFNSFNF